MAHSSKWKLPLVYLQVTSKRDATPDVARVLIWFSIGVCVGGGVSLANLEASIAILNLLIIQGQENIFNKVTIDLHFLVTEFSIHDDFESYIYVTFGGGQNRLLFQSFLLQLYST